MYADLSVLYTIIVSDFTEDRGFVVSVTDRAPLDVIVRWNVDTTNYGRFKLQYKESGEACSDGCI